MRYPPNQRGAATLLFILLVAIALMAISASALMGVSGSQKLQYSEHTATQADMSAWSGVALLSTALAAMPAGTTFTPNSPVTFAGAQTGLSAHYVDTQDGYYVFQITGTSAGATSVVQAAFIPPGSAPSSSGGYLPLQSGIQLHGPTTVGGSVSYSGTGPQSLSVIGGSLTMNGAVSGLSTVCATGDITIAAGIQVTTVCSNGNVTLEGSATINTVDAIGNVLLSGGGSGALGTINSNGTVALSGGSAKTGTINATGNVYVTGGAASATNINTAGNIVWSSTAAGTTLNANGTVNYQPSVNPAVTDITAIGNVTLTAARNVTTKGTTSLVGYYGQGVTGTLASQGLLSGSSWGDYGGAVVSTGTVSGIVAPYPSSVHVTVSPSYTVTIVPLQIPVLPVFSATPVTVDAYGLQSQANFVFTGVDPNGNPKVTVSAVNGVTDGSYFIASKSGTDSNYLCATVSGTICTSTPVTKVCQGYSASNACFSYDQGTWTIQGKSMLPSVLWFQGDLSVSNGTWVNTFIASGNITTQGSVIIYAPNFPSSAYTCSGAADPTNSLQALSSYGLSGSNYATQLCTGSPLTQNGAAIGNIALLAGGYSGSAFSGGNIALGSSNSIYGAVMAGQYLSTGGSTTVAGALYSGDQNASAAGSNTQGGSTTIIDGKPSSAYSPNTAPCMIGCTITPGVANNIAWASPI